MSEGGVELSVAAIQPADVSAWLRARGWTETARLGDLAARWESTEGDVVVPLLPNASDFDLRWGEMAQALAQILQTDISGVLLSIVESASDIAEFRAVGDSLGDSIPLGDAATLIESIRRAMQASANSALQPRSYYGHSLPGVAREHASNVRMGQTRRGSYVVPVISRVPILEPEDQEDARLFDTATAYQPFSRTAMLRLADGLVAIRELTHGETSPTSSQITTSVGAGVSYELCDAVASSLEAGSVDQLDVSFSWAARLPVATPRKRVRLEDGSVEVLRAVSAFLRGERVVGEQTLVGYVKVLDRDKDDPVGRVTIRAFDRDRARNVWMDLATTEYDLASHANNERQLVSVTGELQRESGRALRFVSVSDIHQVEPLPSLTDDIP